MAGDWIKVEVGLPEKSEVWDIAMTLGVDPDLVVGKLIKVWRWFDQHTEDGNAHRVTYKLIDHVAGIDGFAEAMSFAGWLRQDGKDLVLPNFDRHNGKTSKIRALTAKRVAEHKAKYGNAKVTQDPLPREEKRREELIKAKAKPPLSPLPTKNGSRLPAEWSPSQETVTNLMGECPGVNQHRELIKFRDFWAAKAGAGGRKLDWEATYRNWIRKAFDQIGDSRELPLTSSAGSRPL